MKIIRTHSASSKQTHKPYCKQFMTHASVLCALQLMYSTLSIRIPKACGILNICSLSEQKIPSFTMYILQCHIDWLFPAKWVSKCWLNVLQKSKMKEKKKKKAILGIQHEILKMNSFFGGWREGDRKWGCFRGTRETYVHLLRGPHFTFIVKKQNKKKKQQQKKLYIPRTVRGFWKYCKKGGGVDF